MQCILQHLSITIANTVSVCATFAAVWCLGFGSYLLGLGTVGYNLTGGDSTPGNVGIVDATAPGNIIGYGLCIIFIGARTLTLNLILIITSTTSSMSEWKIFAGPQSWREYGGAR